MATEGHPCGGDCVAAEYIKKFGSEGFEAYKQELLTEINGMNISGMPSVDTLVMLNGYYVNLEYPLNNGTKIKFLNDNDVYLGYQVEKKNSDRCFGIVSDGSFILIVEYGENGADPQLVAYKRR